MYKIFNSLATLAKWVFLAAFVGICIVTVYAVNYPALTVDAHNTEMIGFMLLGFVAITAFVFWIALRLMAFAAR